MERFQIRESEQGQEGSERGDDLWINALHKDTYKKQTRIEVIVMNFGKLVENWKVYIA